MQLYVVLFRGAVAWIGEQSVQFSRSVVFDFLWPHGLQHATPPCPPLTPRVYSNSCPSSRWCHPTISSSVVPFSSCLQSFPASGSFQMIKITELDNCCWGLSVQWKKTMKCWGWFITNLRWKAKARGPPCHLINRLSSAAGGQKKLKFGPGFNYDSRRFPEKIKFST